MNDYSYVIFYSTIHSLSIGFYYYFSLFTILLDIFIFSQYNKIIAKAFDKPENSIFYFITSLQEEVK